MADMLHQHAHAAAVGQRARRAADVADGDCEVQVVATRADVTVEEAAREIAAYIRDHEGADALDLCRVLRIPIHIVEQAAERLVEQGRLRHVP